MVVVVPMTCGDSLEDDGIVGESLIDSLKGCLIRMTWHDS